MRVASLIGAILLPGAPAAALNPAHDINQYGHTAWTLRDGVLKRPPRAIAQTPDGYLWLGTDRGLLRFDGVRFVPWQPPEGASLPSDVIVGLVATHDGTLWIGTTQGLASWHGGTLTHYEGLAGDYVGALLAARDGVLWAGTNAGTGTAELCAIRRREVQCFGHNGIFGRFILSLYEDDSRNVWVGAATGLWLWDPLAPAKHPINAPNTDILSLSDGGNGTVLVAMSREISRAAGGSLTKVPLDTADRQIKPTKLLRDRDGALWIGTQDQGLLHVREGRTDRFSRTDGLSGDFVVGLFEDVEGNVWVATLNGMDRFRNAAVATVSTKQGLTNDTVTSVLATGDGSTWIGTIDGLNRWDNGRITREAFGGRLPHEGAVSLFQDRRGDLWVSSQRGLFQIEGGTGAPVSVPPARDAHAIAQDVDGDIWVSDRRQGLLRLRDGEISQSISWSTFGGDFAQSLASDPGNGVWLGFASGGLSRLVDGEVVEKYGAPDGLGRGAVNNLHFDGKGVLWVATEGGLSRLEKGQISTLSSANGLPCDNVQWALDDHAGAVWLHSGCGIVRIEEKALDAWVSRRKSRIVVRLFDGSDGVPGNVNRAPYGPKVTRSPDGRLWFATYDGVGVIDPGRLPFNKRPPLVHIERVTADGTASAATPDILLPALLRDLRIDYTAPSFVAPEKVRFRYKLEGRDLEWVDAADRRQAFYTDLVPGPYRFRVIAANNDDVWSEYGAAWDFSIQPAFYQTNAFRFTFIVAVVLTLAVLYRARMRRLAAVLHLRFEERLAERTRIAQDLHDTLLQGFVSSSMQLHVVAEQVSEQHVRSRLDHILRRMPQVIEDGRLTVSGLRSESPDDLEQALARDCEDFRGQEPIDITVLVEGVRRPLHPLIRDSVYQIAREALANAFRHAYANRVEIAIRYSRGQLRIHIRDNGCGVASDILESGRPGHWGLRGMRERADAMGATLRVSSRVNAGTEVELRVPGRVAFVSPSQRRRRWLKMVVRQDV
jgi:signal transduction histidine kinase/ligand-binding sensor domain-containing protein